MADSRLSYRKMYSGIERAINVLMPALFAALLIVIGGLIEEQVSEVFERVPLLGALPVVGNAFRNRLERVDRTELIVLITPRIVFEPATSPELTRWTRARWRSAALFERFTSATRRLYRRTLPSLPDWSPTRDAGSAMSGSVLRP